MGETPRDSATADLMARLEALATQLTVQHAQLTDQEAQIRRLTAQLARVAPDRSAQPDGRPPSDGERRSAMGAESIASRRDLLRYSAAAVGAAAAAGLAARSAEAANGDPVVIGTLNTGTGATTLQSTNDVFVCRTASAGRIGLSGQADGISGVGVYGLVTGTTGQPVGILGESFSTNSAGTGVNGRGPIGVRGESSAAAGFAVHGRKTLGAGGTAILGEVPAGTSESAIALYGLNNASYAGPGPGAGGFGVYGLSAKGHGLVGATAAAGAAAVVGATNGVAGAYAAAFYGPVLVGGDFTVFGAKSAAVRHPDGSHRRLYCVESPESWFEDFGKAQLHCGQADVAIDPDFAAVAHLDDYHVFLAGYEDFELRVIDQTAAGFRVQARNAASTGRFSWRVVARRKDIAGERLAPVTVPPEPILPDIPVTPDSPSIEALRGERLHRPSRR